MICAGQSFTLIASGADTYTYTSGSAIVSPTSSASYSVTGTSPEGCVSSNTAVASLTVNALPVLTISGSTAICSGSTTTLMVNGANTYSWSTTDITSTVSVSPVATSVYTVTGVDTNGCENTAFHSLTVNPLPVITPINSNSLICTGESSSIFVNGPDTYSWSSGVTGTIIVIAPLNTSSYTVTATTASGCTNSAIATQSVSECTGFASIRAANVAVSVYPNPNNGEFTISSNMEGILSLRNELGQSISIIKLNAGKYHLAVLSNVPNGIYFLSGRVGNEAIHQKIIISK